MREMKDSGIEWVGNIPKEWSVWRNKYIFKITKDIVLPSKNYQLLSLTTTGIKEKDENDNGGKVPENYDGYQVVKENDLVMCLFDLDCSAVFSGLSPYNGMISPAYKVLKVKKRIANEQYYRYWFNYVGSKRFYKQYSKSLRFTLNADEFNRLFSLLPSLVEQQRIAEFLDRECGKIDGLKADIQVQIDTLEQYKRSVITEAVTHGLNPSAPMKDSGVPWVGNIPKHWNCCSLKYNYNTISGATPNSNDISLWDGEIVWVTPADYKTKDVYVFSGARKITYKGYLSCSTTLIKQGNIIFSKRAPIGSVAINKVELCTSQGCLSVVRKTGNVNNKYFYYLFSVNDETFNLFGSGTTFKEISAKNFLSVKFPLPPLDEQQEIADYLDNKCAEIEQIITDKKTQIETLDGYKKSFIYEYVTGKKEVCDGKN